MKLSQIITIFFILGEMSSAQIITPLKKCQNAPLSSLRGEDSAIYTCLGDDWHSDKKISEDESIMPGYGGLTPGSGAASGYNWDDNNRVETVVLSTKWYAINKDYCEQIKDEDNNGKADGGGVLTSNIYDETFDVDSSHLYLDTGLRRGLVKYSSGLDGIDNNGKDEPVVNRDLHIDLFGGLPGGSAPGFISCEENPDSPSCSYTFQTLLAENFKDLMNGSSSALPNFMNPMYDNTQYCNYNTSGTNKKYVVAIYEFLKKYGYADDFSVASEDSSGVVTFSSCTNGGTKLHPRFLTFASLIEDENSYLNLTLYQNYHLINDENFLSNRNIFLKNLYQSIMNFRNNPGVNCDENLTGETTTGYRSVDYQNCCKEEDGSCRDEHKMYGVACNDYSFDYSKIIKSVGLNSENCALDTYLAAGFYSYSDLKDAADGYYKAIEDGDTFSASKFKYYICNGGISYKPFVDKIKSTNGKIGNHGSSQIFNHRFLKHLDHIEYSNLYQTFRVDPDKVDQFSGQHTDTELFHDYPDTEWNFEFFKVITLGALSLDFNSLLITNSTLPMEGQYGCQASQTCNYPLLSGSGSLTSEQIFQWNEIKEKGASNYLQFLRKFAGDDQEVLDDVKEAFCSLSNFGIRRSEDTETDFSQYKHKTFKKYYDTLNSDEEETEELPLWGFDQDKNNYYTLSNTGTTKTLPESYDRPFFSHTGKRCNMLWNNRLERSLNWDYHYTKFGPYKDFTRYYDINEENEIKQIANDKRKYSKYADITKSFENDTQYYERHYDGVVGQYKFGSFKRKLKTSETGDALKEDDLGVKTSYPFKTTLHHGYTFDESLSKAEMKFHIQEGVINERKNTIVKVTFIPPKKENYLIKFAIGFKKKNFLGNFIAKESDAHVSRADGIRKTVTFNLGKNVVDSEDISSNYDFSIISYGGSEVVLGENDEFTGNTEVERIYNYQHANFIFFRAISGESLF